MTSTLYLFLVYSVLRPSYGEMLVVDSLKIDLDRWWGPGEARNVDSSIREFKINFTEQMIDDLRWRIRNRRKPYTPRVEGRHFEDGFNTDQLDSWMDFWSEEYAFKEREAFLNGPPQYLVNIGGLDIHFIWKRAKNSAGKRVIPLMLLHGFAGSIREFYEIIPLLSDENSPRDFVFDLIIPSMPGYGFSEPAVKPGLESVGVAVLYRQLMRRLGYARYFIHGGDWGAVVGAHLATLFYKEVMGYHTTFAIAFTKPTLISWLVGSLDPDSVVEPSLQDRMYPVTNISSHLLNNAGYFLFQSTKPDTISVGVSDSPTSLLAYILHIFSWASRKSSEFTADGGLDQYFSRNQLIDNLMFYWTTNSFASSARLYLESYRTSSPTLYVNGVPTAVPTWTVHAPDELFYMPHKLLKHKFSRVVNSTVLHEGGHFLALEKPQVLAEDIFKAAFEFLQLEAVRTGDGCEV